MRSGRRRETPTMGVVVAVPDRRQLDLPPRSLVLLGTPAVAGNGPFAVEDLVDPVRAAPGSASHRPFAQDPLTGPRRSCWLERDATLEQPPSGSRAEEASMFSVMTWNLENFERPAANADQAVKER
jgi:hypothetical protein